MAIIMRNGLAANFDPNKMRAGELAIVTDARELHATFAPGDSPKVLLDGEAVPNPETAGTNGQILSINEDGDPEWGDVGAPTDEQVGEAVSDWLDAHPEATTTVEDGAITYAKLDSNLKGTVDDVGELKSDLNFVADGVIVPVEQSAKTYMRSYIRSTGAIGTSTTSCTTKFNNFGTGMVVFSAPTGFKISAIAEYSGTTDSTFVRFIQSTDSTVSRFLADATKYYCVSIRKTDESTITLDDIPDGLKVFTVLSQFTDTTLAKSGKAADSEVTGKVLADSGVVEFPNIMLEQGTISTTNGDNQPSTTRLRTPKMIYANNLRVSVGAGFKFSWRAYDASNEFVASSDWLSSDTTLGLASNVSFIRFVVAYADNEGITPSVATGLRISAPSVVSGTNTTNRASFCGNKSVRAAKTINFTDGTPPIIDWYLLQDTAGNFYQSKDLMSCKYLFTFTPPSGNISDWSAGIAANNDIVFVADAAGLADTAGRLKDENRINPVCFLAAENYAVMHVIDFGENKKPCGWLGNVGYCLLPNGNIVMCEYTRGTVKTANVWLIEGDVSNPENWTVTWTTNIIDVIDSTTAGVKHCHQVQYDFYTGIVYFGTGDSPTGSYTYYSDDNGETWALLYGPDKARCRVLSYVFTSDKVYWATDTHETDYHKFFIAERDVNGLIDVENAESIALDSTNGQSCYGCVYIKALNCIVMMDRCDGTRSSFYWYCYDLESETVKQIGQWSTVDGSNTYLGFRTKFVDWYPRTAKIVTGFNPSTGSSIQDTNRNPLCGNESGADGDGVKRINTLLLYLYKCDGAFSFMADTIWS